MKVRLSVSSLFQLLVGLAAFAGSSPAGAADVTVAWDPNTEPDLAGYRVYYSASEQRMVDVGTQTTATLTDLEEGHTYTIYATAYNTAGLESQPSESIIFTPAAATLQPPSLSSQPLSQATPAGESVTFSVQVIGDAPLAYQWFHDGAPIAGANAASYTIPTITADHAGAYIVVVTNAAGEVSSEPAILTIAAPLAITSHPVGQSVAAGTTVFFSVQASGSGTLSYQWFREGVALPGATSQALTLSSITTADVGIYTVQVSDAYSQVTSAPAVLIVSQAVAPVILTHPASQTVNVGQGVTFSMTISGTGPFTYQWFRNGSPITGATAATYSIAAVTDSDAASYQVRVFNAAGMTTSSPGILTVIAPPVITSQPASREVEASQPVSLTVKASGSGTLAYQWFKGSDPVPGGTGATYTIAAATKSDAGNYRVRVSNSAGEVRSAIATITVASEPVQPSADLQLSAGQGTLELAGAATPGATYLLQSASDLTAGDWTTLQTITVDSTGQFQVELPHDPSAPFRFFRTIIAQE